MEAYLEQLVSVKDLSDQNLLDEEEVESMTEEALVKMEAMHKKHLVGGVSWRKPGPCSSSLPPGQF